jgi:hypothetical protein
MNSNYLNQYSTYTHVSGTEEDEAAAEELVVEVAFDDDEEVVAFELVFVLDFADVVVDMVADLVR